MKSVLRALSLVALMSAAFPALALDKPTGDVILTITGSLANTNSDAGAQFDLAMLEALQSRTGEMETPWTEGKVKLSGPLLRAVLEAAGADGSKMNVKAINDYSAEVPMEDAKLETILATRMNDELLSVRDKGPLFLVYPFDLDSGLYNEKYFSRSVWQIKEIEVVK